MSTFPLRKPTASAVIEAGRKFDETEEAKENALTELFRQYPANHDLSHVLLKVVTVNSLYSTQIYAVVDLAKQIQKKAEDLDRHIAAGSAIAVNEISKFTVSSTGKDRSVYSFATKYCSWHNPAAFPIFDGQVERYLWHLQKQDRFAKVFLPHDDFWDYLKFVELLQEFRIHYALQEFDFKQLDKFLYSEEEANSEIQNLHNENAGKN